MEQLQTAWDYCKQKLSFKSNTQKIKASSDTLDKEEFNSSIDQALGFSTSLEKINLNNFLQISSSSVSQVKNVIYLQKVSSLIQKSKNIYQDKMPAPRTTPYLDEHKQQFNQLNIQNVYQCKRENIYYIQDFPQAKLHTEHADTIICSNNTCILASFHENTQRVDQGIYKKGQGSKVYQECSEYEPTKQIKFNDAQNIIDELKKEKYDLFNNNCFHSSQKLINKLDLVFKEQISSEKI